MPFNEQSRSAIGLAQELDELEAAHDPRQAWVTRAEGNGVWVRFRRNGTEPESWFPSTHAGLPAGFMGWVYPIGGGKGMFVATGVPFNDTKSAIWEGGNQTLSTAGTFLGAASTPEVFTNLIASVTYKIELTTSVRYATEDNGNHRISCQVVGATTDLRTAGNVYRSSGVGSSNIHVYSTYMMPDENGEISFTPAIVWSNGTVTFSRVSTTATIRQETP